MMKQITDNKDRKLKFIDLFAGIGGIRLGFEMSGCKCVFSSEIDKDARVVYQVNFKDENVVGDITKIESSIIPDFDILCGGFPCQSFSMAGKRKGFDDTRGTLFFEILRILRDKKPNAFFLENVKGLLSHDKGRTFDVIKRSIKSSGYSFHYSVINANCVVPQNRERVYMVGFKNGMCDDFKFPYIEDRNCKLRDIIETDDVIDIDKYTISDGLWNCLKKYKEKYGNKGGNFEYKIPDINGRSGTLPAHYSKGGGEILISQGESKNPRKLTPRECARLQGFPDTFKLPEYESDANLYKQFGNSVDVPVVYEIARKVVDVLMNRDKYIPIYSVIENTQSNDLKIE